VSPPPSPDLDHQTAINWLLGTLTLVLGWLAGHLWTEVAVLRKASADAAAAFVPRVEMHKYLDDLRLEMQRDIDNWKETALGMHEDNKKRFDRLDDAIIRLYDHIGGKGNKRP
jgi:hypothetical protein